MNIQIKDKLYELFKESERNLFLTYEELAKTYKNTTPTVWETFLDEPDVKQFVLQRTAKLTEINARKALRKLSNGSFEAQEVSALKSLIEASTILTKKANQHEHIFVSFVPVPDYITKGGNATDEASSS